MLAIDRQPTSIEVKRMVRQERLYIWWEAKRLFKRNKNITDLERIDKKLFEASSRLELAVCQEEGLMGAVRWAKLKPHLWGRGQAFA